jgi:hypothetical protein
MLCGICSRAAASGAHGLISTDPTLLAWWQQHQAADDARRAAEAADSERADLIRQAESKLTPAEREALGIRG